MKLGKLNVLLYATPCCFSEATLEFSATFESSNSLLLHTQFFVVAAASGLGTRDCQCSWDSLG